MRLVSFFFLLSEARLDHQPGKLSRRQTCSFGLLDFVFGNIARINVNPILLNFGVVRNVWPAAALYV